MARKGEEARAQVVENIKRAFGKNFVTIQDKKIYVTEIENGEPIQFAISITQPKVPIEVDSEGEDDFFKEKPSKTKSINTEENKKIQEESVRKLKERLGL